MADAKHEETFKVVDRRLFTESGELRKEVAEEAERERAADSAAAAKAAKDSSKGASKIVQPGASANPSKVESSAAAPAIPESQASSGSKPAAGPNRNFQMLVDFMARNAAMLLGGYADPRTGQPMIDLDGAREMIDMLDALRDTTRGNLAEEDDRLLLEVIGSLKLSFMEISKAAASAAKEKAKSRP